MDHQQRRNPGVHAAYPVLVRGLLLGLHRLHEQGLVLHLGLESAELGIFKRNLRLEPPDEFPQLLIFIIKLPCPELWHTDRPRVKSLVFHSGARSTAQHAVCCLKGRVGWKLSIAAAPCYLDADTLSLQLIKNPSELVHQAITLQL